MKILKDIKVSTGNIYITRGEKGFLEFLSIGDYGKEKNIKADFLGYTNEINGVPHDNLLPLEEKWVITISTQYGCSMNCTFCDVPKVGKGINATLDDLISQVVLGISLHPEVKYTKRLNLHYARMGEPTFNNNVLDATRVLKRKILDDLNWGFHPVISTMCPSANKNLYTYLLEWLRMKNVYLEGEAGLQLSINSTDEIARQEMFSRNALNLEDISDMFITMFKHMRYSNMPILKGRKITLNFALTGNEINAKKLKKLFDPALFLCKITPMHETKACIDNDILSSDGYNEYYPYKYIEENLKNEGFDVIVFVPSIEEDQSKITCGNAILSENNIIFKEKII